jgi:DNA-binding transcriptional ArsR family regulator
MGVWFVVPEAAGEGLAFVYSPALEAVLSLHVLVEPKHHPLHHQWVREARRRMPGDMKRLIAGFRFAHADYLPPVLLPSALGEYPSFEEEMQRLHDLGPDLGIAILSYFVGASAEREVRSGPDWQTSLVRRASGLGSATEELVRVGVVSLDELASRFLVFLARYWDEGGFQDEWGRIEPQLAETVAEAGRVIAERGFFGWLRTLSSKVRIDEAAGTFSFRRDAEEEIAVGGGVRLVLVPSAFLWPHIALVNNPPRAAGLAYPAPFATYEASPRVDATALTSLLQAVGNPTRLRALQLIAEHPRSTQELARLIGISEAALSKQLRQLTDAGVLRTRRDGYYVLYSLVRERIAHISANLLAFVDAPDPHR